MPTKHSRFVVDLTKIKGEGSFPCPKCGTLMDPSDKNNSKYRITKSIVKNHKLIGLIITCRKCRSPIEMTGFAYTPPRKSSLRQEYNKLEPLYSCLASEVEYHLKKCLEKDKIQVHSICHRIKKFESFYEKIQRKETKDKFFDRIEDMAAVRVICLYLGDLERVGRLILNEFRILKIDISRTRSEVHFGYMSDHYLVTLPEQYTGSRYDEIKKLNCEIQVRTLLMHAWATISHRLVYKKKSDIPTNFRKEFNAISGALFLADSHFDSFREKTDKSRRDLEKKARLGKLDLDQEIDLDNLEVFLFWKYPQRDIGNIPNLLSDIRRANLRTLKDLDSIANHMKKKSILSRIERQKKDTASDLLRMYILFRQARR